MDPHDSSAADWYVARGTEKEGPYSLAALRGMLSRGRLSGTDLVWKLGGTEWRRIDRVDELVPPPPTSTQIRGDFVRDPIRPVSPPIDSIAPEPPRSEVRQVAAATSIAKSPWNPAGIVVLAVLFTPMWAGVMAALNAARLRRPVWQPLAIGFGYLGVSIAQSAVIDSTFLDWILYLGAVAILWFAVLQHQFALFECWRTATGNAGSSWTWPVVSGVPLAILAFLALVVGPLMPLEPRQVCERFLQASSEQGMKDQATKNLWPAIAALCKSPSRTELFDCELTEDGPAPPDIGGHVVGFRFFFSEFGENHRREGFFHVVDRNGSWKIEDVVVTAIDHEPLENWSLLSRDYVYMTPPPAANRVGQQANAQPAADGNGQPRQKQWFEQPGVLPGIGRILNSKVGKGIGVTLLAVLGVLAKFGKSLAKLATPSSAETK
jgi:hypothetical protein